jgi:hypothetical protein
VVQDCVVVNGRFPTLYGPIDNSAANKSLGSTYAGTNLPATSGVDSKRMSSQDGAVPFTAGQTVLKLANMNILRRSMPMQMENGKTRLPGWRMKNRGLVF